VQKTFERFSVGKPGDKSMNQKTFREFCEEMGMVNPGEGLQQSLSFSHVARLFVCT